MFRKSLIIGLFMLFVVQIPALVLASGNLLEDLEGEIQKIREEIAKISSESERTIPKCKNKKS
jgi:hypothetical protein